MAVFTNIEGKGTPKKGVSLRRMFKQLDESNKYSQFFYNFTEVEVGVFDLHIYFDLFGEEALKALGQLDTDLRPHFDHLYLNVTHLSLTYKGYKL